jgi:ABC-type bacteriocin/lantibiotic exporter with double-glycine peptidase domain
MAFSRAARLAGVVFGVVPLAFILFIGVGYLSALADSRLLDVEGHAGTLLEQILSSVRVVQSFAAENFLAKKYDQYLSQVKVSITTIEFLVPTTTPIFSSRNWESGARSCAGWSLALRTAS